MNNLEDEMAEIVAKEIQKEIDESVMLEILVECGWIKVPYHFETGDHAVDVMNWLDNIRGNYKRLSGSFIFSDKKDAEWFILRWS